VVLEVDALAGAERDVDERDDLALDLAGAVAEAELGHVAQARRLASARFADQVLDVERRLVSEVGASRLPNGARWSASHWASAAMVSREPRMRYARAVSSWENEGGRVEVADADAGTSPHPPPAGVLPPEYCAQPVHGFRADQGQFRSIVRRRPLNLRLPC